MKIYKDIQQGSLDWFQLKLGKITGTVLSDLMGTPRARQEAMYEIIAERLTPKVQMEYENPMARGVRLEGDAIIAFEIKTGKIVSTAGFCESDKLPWIGYSPDGLIYDKKGNVTEDVEVKCPMGKNYMKIVMTDEVPKEYHWQIVQGFVTNPKLKKRWFVAYNPDVISYPIHIIECKRKDYKEDIMEAEVAEKNFIEEIEENLKTINYKK